MALKPDRDVLQWDISRFIGAITYGGDRGGVVVATGTVPSGAAMDQSVSQVWYHHNATTRSSGVQPIGVLMSDVVNIDLNRQILNPSKSEHQLNDKVPLVTKGWVVTNMVTGAGSVAVGANAFLAGSGFVTPDAGDLYANTEGVTTTQHPKVGRFLTKPDEDGYAKLYVDL